MVDVNAQQLDLRPVNSWMLKLDQVEAPELAEVFVINAIAPFVLNSKLKPLMMRGRTVPPGMPVRPAPSPAPALLAAAPLFRLVCAGRSATLGRPRPPVLCRVRAARYGRRSRRGRIRRCSPRGSPRDD